MYWIVLLSEVTLIIVSGSLIVTVDFAFPFTSFVAFFYVFQYFRFVNVIYSDNNFWLLFRWLILFYFLGKALYLILLLLIRGPNGGITLTLTIRARKKDKS